MFTLTGFGDEISPKLSEQMDVLESEGIKFIDLRGVNDKNVLDFSDREAEEVKKQMTDRGFGVSAIASPIGKIKITDDFLAHLDKFKKAIHFARFFKTSYIRLFSYYIPDGEEPEKYRSEVMNRMKEKTKLAKQSDVILLHENESGIYGNTGKRCQEILETVNSSHLRAIFDPANFVVEGQRPYTDCFDLLKKYIVYMHIKDANMKTKAICPAGEGDGQIKKVLADLRAAGFDGFVSLEPHLSFAGSSKGFSGGDLFKKAIQALKKIINEI